MSLSRYVRRIAALATLALVATVVPSTTAQAADPTITIYGHGYGHGRGMGQYGALGLAVDHGWSASQILDYFYGGTVTANVGNRPITVELTAFSGAPLVAIGRGLTINGAPRADVNADGSSVRVTRQANGTFVIETGTNCGGPWTGYQTTGAPVTIGTTTLSSTFPGLVRACESTGERAYRGTLTAQSHAGTGAQANFSALASEDYLRGVVPRESLASWGTAGGGRGMQALMAQSVAARSYALSGSRPSGATTCDTTACQVYGGAAFQEWGKPQVILDADMTNQAIDATFGTVRFFTGTTTTARTEFSSSTGGYSAGGTFPAVEDAGDDTASNSNHNWTRSIGLAALGTALGTGPISSIAVTGRNGLGAEGGRVKTVRVVATGGAVRDFTGNQVRVALALKSDWFSLSGLTPAETQAIVKAMYADLLLRDVDPAGLAAWTGMLQSGASQGALVNSLTSSEEYINLRIRQAYLEVLGREPEPGGVAGWRQEILARRATVDDVKRRFYDTQEYYNISGGTQSGYIELLYRTAFERSASPGESAYWSGQIAAIGRTNVVNGIWLSMEAAKYRAAKYYVTFLKRPADQGGQDYWARILLANGEGAVRTGIAGSEEYRNLAVTRFP